MKRQALHVGLLLVVAAIVRLYRLDAHGLWLDEMFSVSSASGGVLAERIGGGDSFTPADFWREDSLPRTIRAVIRNDNGNGILYDLLLRAWVKVAGRRDFAVRLPSVALGVLTVSWTYALARRIATPPVAWWAGAIAAFHPLLVRFSQEARPYAMAAALGVLCTWWFVRLAYVAEPDDGGRVRDMVGYALTAAAAVLTHYLAAVVLAIHLGFALFARRPGRARRATVAALGAATVVAALWMPLGGAEGLRGMARLAESYRERSKRGDADRFLRPLDVRMVGAGIVQMVSPVAGGAVEGWGVPLWQTTPLLLVAGGLAAAGWRERRRLERIPGALAPVLALSVAPIASSTALALASGHGVSFLTRYGVFAAPFAAIVLAFGLASGARLVRAAATAQAAVMAASLAAVYLDVPRYRGPNRYAEMAARIRAAPPAEVVYRSWMEARMVNLHLPPAPLPRQRVSVSRP